MLISSKGRALAGSAWTEQYHGCKLFYGGEVTLCLIIYRYILMIRVLSSTAPARLLYFMCLVIEVFSL